MRSPNQVDRSLNNPSQACTNIRRPVCLPYHSLMAVGKQIWGNIVSIPIVILRDWLKKVAGIGHGRLEEVSANLITLI